MNVPSESDRFVEVRAYLSDEGFGYDCWHARQFLAPATARPAVLIVCADAAEQAAALAFLRSRETNVGGGTESPR